MKYLFSAVSILLTLFYSVSVKAQSSYLNAHDFTSLGVFNPGSNVSVNMTTGQMSGGSSAAGVVQGGILVFTFDSFTLGTGISITFTNVSNLGNKVAFLSKSDMIINGTINANASGVTAGPGGGFGGALVNGQNGFGPGGGSSNAGSAGGGFGGIGGEADEAPGGGGIIYGNLSTALQGGSGGAWSSYNTLLGYGGGGGGAIELGAKLTLTINNGALVSADGAPGQDPASEQLDAGGGGSGGGILIHGKNIVINAGAVISAKGGRGGNTFVGTVAGYGPGYAGGGGGGGRILLAYHITGSITNNGTLSIGGGAAGIDITGGNNGHPGTAGNTTTLQVNNDALPVELTSFTAKPEEGKVTLNWNTAMEINNYGFDIERRAGSKKDTAGNWEAIGFVAGHGNSNSPKQYSFTDENPPSGVLQYRLKQTDNDGRYEYSPLSEVFFNNIPDDFTLFNNYPNPANPSTSIKYGLPVRSMVIIAVYNSLGEKVKELVNEARDEGFHEIKWNASDVSSGIYFYTIKAKEEGGSKEFGTVRKMLILK